MQSELKVLREISDWMQSTKLDILTARVVVALFVIIESSQAGMQQSYPFSSINQVVTIS